MKRELTWILAAKLAALGLLWLLFFSGSHRVAVDVPDASLRPAIAAMPASDSEPDPRSRPQERTGD